MSTIETEIEGFPASFVKCDAPGCMAAMEATPMQPVGLFTFSRHAPLEWCDEWTVVQVDGPESSSWHNRANACSRACARKLLEVQLDAALDGDQ